MRRSLTTIIALLFVSNSIVKSAVIIDTVVVSSNSKHKLSISIPNNYDASKKYPLVIAIQPCMSLSYRLYLEALKPLTDSLKMIVACPDNSFQAFDDSKIGFIKASIDSARAMYNIDEKSIYFNGMSCNGEVVLRNGLNKIYPFRGIVPWAAYLGSSKYNFNSDMPVTIAIGTKDDYPASYALNLNVFDSLKVHGAKVNLVLVPGATHSYTFANFGNEMIRSIYYINDTNNIKIEPTSTNSDSYVMLNTDGEKVVEYKISHVLNKEMVVSAISSNSVLMNDPTVEYTPADGIVKLKFSPISGKKGNAIIILEVKEKSGTAIKQVTFKVTVNANISAIVGSELNTNLEVYPNPASDKLNLKCAVSDLSIQITDINGRIVLKAKNLNSNVIDISGLKTGLYFLKATGKYNYNTVKFSSVK